MGNQYGRIVLVAFVILFLGFTHTFTFGQTIQSVTSGAWNNPSSWSPAVVPTAANSTSVLINSGNTITVTAPITIDQVTILSGGSLVVNSGVLVTLNNGSGDEITVSAGGSLTNHGTIAFGSIPLRTILVSGDVHNDGTFSNPAANKFGFLAGSNYYHEFADAGVVPTASWNVTSTVNIVGYTSGNSTPPSGLGQTFGNFVWNAPGQDVTIVLNEQPVGINGNFQIISTGVDALFYSSGEGGGTLTVGGNFISSGPSATFGFSSGDSGPSTLNVNGDIIISDGYVQFADDQDVTINLSGNFTLSGNGQADFSASVATTTLNISGNFTQSGSSSYAASGGIANFNFTGTAVQTYINNNLPVPAGTINYNIPNAAILSIPGTNNFIGGTGTLTVASGGTLEVGSTDPLGAIQTGTTKGNIRVSGTRTYSSGADITYNGTSAQVIGNGHPSVAGVDITIANPSGVSIIAPTTLAGTINLTSGNLNIANSALTISGNITGPNKISIGTLGSLTMAGSANIGTFPFTAGPQTFANFTLNNSNGIAFANDVTLTGLITLTNGTLDFSNQTLTLNGTSTVAAGNLSGNTSSTLIIGGNGAFGSLAVAPGNSIGTLTFNRTSGTATINSSLTVSTALNLLNGALTNTNGLTVANGAILTRSSNAQLLGNAPTDLSSGQTYSVVYTGGALTTGLELPNTTDDMLGSLTINSGGAVTLDKNIIIHNDLNLLSSTLQAGAFTITMAGSPAIWNKGGGTFDGGTGTVIVTGSVTINQSSGTATFFNLSANSGGSLTLPAGNIDIGGDLLLVSGSTFNANGGTVIFNGSGTQTITGSGNSLNNINVNKTAGLVDILPTLNLIGILNIQTATTIDSHSGDLVLVSTTDASGPGNASIAKIPSGASVTGTVVTQRFMSAKGRVYQDISSPVQTATVQDIINSGITVTGFSGSSYPCAGCATNNPSMYYYDETAPYTGSGGLNGYTPITSASQSLAVGRGYNVLIRNELGAVKLVLPGPINSGTISLPISYTNTGSTDDGTNFVGNPYPSSIDWDASTGWTKTNIAGNMISVWDPVIGQYRTWNSTTGSLGSGKIAEGQGFWIQASAAPTLTITEDAKTNVNQTFFRVEKEPVHAIEIAIQGGNNVQDWAYIQKLDGSTLGSDANDGYKIGFDNFNIATLTADKKRVAINTVGEIITEGQIGMQISNAANGSYTFSKTAQGDFSSVKVSIFDKFTNTVNDLSAGKIYTFTISDIKESQATDRFVVVLGESTITGLEPNSFPLSVYPNPVASSQKINIAVSASEIPAGHILDSMGKEIGKLNWEKGAESATEWHSIFDMSSYAAGLYIAQVRVNNSVQLVKFIRN